MTFRYPDLDAAVRALMVEEIERDAARGALHEGRLLTPLGRAAFLELLVACARSADSEQLTAELARPEYFLAHEPPRGDGATRARRVNVPGAARRLAEGEFNRYYMRAVCRRASELGVVVEVFRARESGMPRGNSQRLLGRRYEARTLLESLRGGHAGAPFPRGDAQGKEGGGDGFLLPGDVNSGLSLVLARPAASDAWPPSAS